MKRLRFIYLAAILIMCALSLFLAWKYTVRVAQTNFESDVILIRRNFYQGIVSTEQIANIFKSFVEIDMDMNQEKFGKFSSDILKNNAFLNSTHYFACVKDNERLKFEKKLQTEKLGTTILDTSRNSTEGLIPAEKNSIYFPTMAVDNASKDITYFGWNAYSDKDKKETIDLVIKTKSNQATKSYLLDSGNVAVDIFVPILSKKIEKKLLGIVSVTVDLTKLIGDEQWRRNVEIILTTTLRGDKVEKSIFRQVDTESRNKLILTTLRIDNQVQQFGQVFGLIIQRDLILPRINFGIIILTLIGCIILVILALYLLFTHEKLIESNLKLSDANEFLETRVLERTNELSLAHAQIKEVLDNLDDVVLTLTPNLKIEGTYSPASLRILGVDSIIHKDLRDILFSSLDKYNEKEHRHLSTLEIIETFNEFQWSLSVDDLLNVVSLKINNELRTLTVRYSPIFLNDQLQKIILVATDITEILTLKANLAAKEEESNIKEVILRENLLSNHMDTHYFYKECNPRIDIIKTYKDKLTRFQAITLLRELHNIKGSARCIGLVFFSKKIHMLEDSLEPVRIAISKNDPNIPSININELNDIVKLYTEYEELYKNLIENKNLSSPAITALVNVEKFLSVSKNESTNILDWINKFKSEQFFSLKELFYSFFNSMTETSENICKKVVFQSPEWDIFLDISVRSVFSEAFTHSLRNAIDHGIELPEERTSNGKTEFGTIQLELHNSNEFITIRIRDDGRGVNLQKIYEIARSKNLIQKPFEQMSETELIELLFAPGFSTKTEITELSGRGVGLDAVRTSCSLKGIFCRIISQVNIGSSFELKIPNKYIQFMMSPKFELTKIS